VEATEVVPQLILTTKKTLLFGFKALFVFPFQAFLHCWTASILYTQKQHKKYASQFQTAILVIWQAGRLFDIR
jgi:nitrate reductase gamma subunit